MKSQSQKIQDEFGIYLQMVRAKKRIAQKHIADRLGYTTTNFVSRIERGAAPVPLDRVAEFARAYDLPVPEFTRLVLVANHNDTYRALLAILLNDKGFAEKAYRCHTVKDIKKIRKRRKQIDPGLASESLELMRNYILENKEFIPKGKYNKRSLMDGAE